MSGAQTGDLLISVLGDVQCWVHGKSVPGLTRTVKRVVAMLAGWPGSSINRDRVIVAVWGTSVPSDAYNSLQGHVAALRRAIGRDWILTTEEGYALSVNPDAVDAERFISLADRGLRGVHAGQHDSAHPLLMEARDLWRGVPFNDVEDAELIARRERLTEVYERVRESILECRLKSARTPYEAADVVPWAKEEVARSPLRERRYEILMQALIAAERPAEAIDVYRTAESFLRSHGGIRPGPGLAGAHELALAARAEVLAPMGTRVAMV